MGCTILHVESLCYSSVYMCTYVCVCAFGVTGVQVVTNRISILGMYPTFSNTNY